LLLLHWLGRQWCGIIHYHWWTASIKPRLLFSRAGYASWGLSLSSVLLNQNCHSLLLYQGHSQMLGALQLMYTVWYYMYNTVFTISLAALPLLYNNCYNNMDSPIYLFEKSKTEYATHVLLLEHGVSCLSLDISIYAIYNASSDTQGWFRSLHRPLGQLVEFSSIDRWTNTIISLVASSFLDEQDDQRKQFKYESGYLIGPHTITLNINFGQ